MQQLKARSLELTPGDVIPFWEFSYEVIDQPRIVVGEGSKLLMATVNVLVAKPAEGPIESEDDGTDLFLTTFHAPLDHTFTVWRPVGS